MVPIPQPCSSPSVRKAFTLNPHFTTGVLSPSLFQWAPVRLCDLARWQALPEADLEATRKPYAQCAVVGESVSLLQQPLGAFIDSHAAVFRFAHAPTKGFETHVGALPNPPSQVTLIQHLSFVLTST